MWHELCNLHKNSHLEMETRGVNTAEPVVQEQHVWEVRQLQLTSQLSLLLATHDVRLQKKRAVFSADRTE